MANKPTTKQTPQQRGKAPPPPNKNVVPMKNNAGVPAHVQQGAGRGLSQRQEDNIVPLIYVLQSLSPQVLKQRKESYIPGAEAGDFWLRGTKTVYKGGEDGEGVLAQPCHHWSGWIEWRPKRGGFVARHDEMPRDAVSKTIQNDSGDDVEAFVRPSGNIVAQSHEYAVRLFDDDYNLIGAFVFPFTGGKIGSSRMWMTLMNGVRVGDGKRADMFSCYYRMKTVPLSNDSGDWYGLNVEHDSKDGSPHWVSVEDYRAGEQLYSDFEGGKLRADTEEGAELGAEDAADV